MIAAVRRFLVVPAAVAILGIAYLVMCLLVFLTSGRRWPLEKKLALGCLLVSLTTMSIPSSWASGTCYEPALPKIQLVVDGEGKAPTDTITVTRGATKEIPGILRYGQSYSFIYQIVSGREVLAEGEVLPVDGKLDTSEERVRFSLDCSKVPAGTYDLVIWGNYRSGNKWLRMEPVVRKLTLKVIGE